jgi:hypothetical protein
MSPSATRQSPRLRFPLQDILALVAGYGMAALLFRAFWPTSRPSPALGLPGLGLYLWLGLAMSGPILLFRHGPRPDREQDDPHGDSPPTAARTWAELAWTLIGIYWIILGVFSIPTRLHEFKLGDMVLFGLVPVVLALGFRLFGPRPPSGRAMTAWTHPAAVVLLITWPVAWACLIVWGRALR